MEPDVIGPPGPSHHAVEHVGEEPDLHLERGRAGKALVVTLIMLLLVIVFSLYFCGELTQHS